MRLFRRGYFLNKDWNSCVWVFIIAIVVALIFACFLKLFLTGEI